MARGAAHVTAIDPAGAGSRSVNVLDSLRSAVRGLGFDNVEILGETFQDVECPDASFHVVVLSASVNHLDEDACIQLLDNESSRGVYLEIFNKLRRLTVPGGVVILTDVSRRNFFGDLGLRNPFSPTIDWRKHQTPETWIALLSQVGFEQPRIDWVSPSQYLFLGAPFRYRWFAYLRSSFFRITVRAPA